MRRPTAEPAPAQALGPGMGSALVRLARNAVECWVRSRVRIQPPGEPEVLREPRGVFVTLTEQGKLRGCIGHPYPVLALGEALVDCAIAAASEDPRFEPVGAKELGALHVEVSVLTPPRPVEPAAVVVGRDGLLVSAGGRRGLLLPQVAVEQGWDRESFLAHACQKAGLDPQAWRSGASVQAFTAEIYGED